MADAEGLGTEFLARTTNRNGITYGPTRAFPRGPSAPCPVGCSK